MIIAMLLLLLCLAATVVLTAMSRSPLLRTLALSFDCWAEHRRTDYDELS